LIVTARPSRSTSTQRSPAASPRRSPRSAISHHRAYSLSAFDEAEELGELVLGPYCDRRPFSAVLPRLDPGLGPDLGRRPAWRGQLDLPGRVVPQQPFPDGGVEGRPQRRPDPMQRRRRQRPPMTRRRLGQHSEHLRHIPAGQLGQPDPAQVRDQMPVDVLAVGPQRGRPDAPPRAQPPRQPPAHRPGLGGRVLGRAFQELIAGGLGRPPGREPAAAYPLSQHGRYRAVEVPGTVTPLPQPGAVAFQPPPRPPIPAATPLEHRTPCAHSSTPFVNRRPRVGRHPNVGFLSTPAGRHQLGFLAARPVGSSPVSMRCRQTDCLLADGRSAAT
jgi:hypothetical protein